MILITGDWHCHNHTQFSRILEGGTNSRLQDALDCVWDMATYASCEHIKTLVIAGDVFHTRKSIENTVLDRVCRLFEKLEESFSKIYIIAGNHDMSVTGDGSLSISALRSSKTTVIAAPSIVRIDNASFGFIPYTTDVSILDEAFTLFKNTDYVIGHLGILGGKVGPSDFEVPGVFAPEDLSPESFKHIFLGHYHKHQEVSDNITYIGSPLQIGWGERDEEKGFIVLDCETDSFEFVVNEKSPRFIVTEYERMSDFKENDYVRIIHEPDAEVSPDLFDTQVPVQLEEVRKDKESEVRIDLHGKGDLDILKAYINHNPLEGFDSEKVARYGIDILSKVE